VLERSVLGVQFPPQVLVIMTAFIHSQDSISLTILQLAPSSCQNLTTKIETLP